MKHIRLRSDKPVISDALCRVVSSLLDNCLLDSDLNLRPEMSNWCHASTATQTWLQLSFYLTKCCVQAKLGTGQS